MHKLPYVIAIAMLQMSPAAAQTTDTIPLRFPPLSQIGDSAAETMPPSHKSAAKQVDRPVRVRYCPEPSYPTGLAEYGFAGHVIVRFVVDTLGYPEVEHLVVWEASHPGFVPAARRTVAKCRFLPAEKDGRPVRLLVQQRISFRLRDPDSGK
jgi:outer membrane biosynthesis protein TonB